MFSVSLRLPAGTHIRLGGTPINISGVSVTIQSNCGDNTSYPVIDAELASNVFIVSASANLTLTCVRVINGVVSGKRGGDLRGGCVVAEGSATLTLTAVFFSSCSAVNTLVVSPSLQHPFDMMLAHPLRIKQAHNLHVCFP